MDFSNKLNQIIGSITVILFSTVLNVTAFCQTEKPCPEKPGLYVDTGNMWSEIAQEAAPLVVTKMSGFYGLLYDKEFAGDSAFITLENPHQFCVVGANNATFSLEKAKVKKKRNRTIVQYGNYHGKKEDQSQQLAVITDEQGNTHLTAHSLDSGQYILVVHGTISKPRRPTAASSSSDAMAEVMVTSAAIASSAILGNGGVYFGFGIK